MKEQLAQLIEAYAAARYSQNNLLIETASAKINEFLSKVEVVELPPAKPQIQLQQDTPAEAEG